MNLTDEECEIIFGNLDKFCWTADLECFKIIRSLWAKTAGNGCYWSIRWFVGYLQKRLRSDT